MKRIQSFLPLLLFVTAVITISFAPAKQKKVLVFSKTAGYRHASAIVAGKKRACGIRKEKQVWRRYHREFRRIYF